MLKFIIKRLLMIVPIILSIIIIVYTLLYFAPGDPVVSIVGINPPEAERVKIEAEWGFDKPYIVQLGNYIFNLLKGDMGRSFQTKQPIVEELKVRLPVTLKLASLTMLLGVIIGIVLGVISAVFQNSWVDNLARVFGLFSVSMPIFWWALMLILFFSVTLRWLPSSGSYGFKYWILPVVTLGWNASAGVMRMTRSSMLEVIRSDYVRTARAKGQKEIVIIFKHVLRNSLIPIVTVIGTYFGQILAGAIVCEQIFSFAGIGRYIYDAISFRNYPAVVGAVIVNSALFAIINLIVDIAYTFIDPRLKTIYTGKAKKVNAA